MNKSLMHKNNKDDWETPWPVFEEINSCFNERFALDVAASKENHKCPAYFDKEFDALENTWTNFPDYYQFMGLWWCNPPFSRVRDFLIHAHEQKTQGVMLVPASLETAWFRAWITERDLPFLIWPQRISFLNPETGLPGRGNTGASALVSFLKCPPNALPRIMGQPWKINA